MLLTKEQFRSLMTQEGEFWREIEEAKEFIEEEVRGAIEWQKKGWRWERKVMLWKERIYVSNSATLQEEIITRHHNIMLPVNLQWKVAFDIHYTNEFLIRICSRTHYKSLEYTKKLYAIVSR